MDTNPDPDALSNRLIDQGVNTNLVLARVGVIAWAIAVLIIFFT